MTGLEAQYGRIEALLGKIDGRLDRMDGRLDKLDDRLRGVEVDVAKIDGRISQLPSVWTFVTTVFGSYVVLVGLVLAAIRFAAGHLGAP